MIEELCLKDESDSWTREILEKSNRKYELRQELGPEIIGRIEELREQDHEYGRRTWAGVTVGCSIAGGVCSLINKGEEKLSRRELFNKLFISGSAGLLVGALLIGPFSYLITDGSFYSRAETELIPKNPESAEKIKEYLKLRYPQTSI